MSIRSCLFLLALVVLASASVQRVYRDFSQDVVEGINPSSPGRRIAMEVVATTTASGQRRLERQNPCKSRIAAMSTADQRACRAQITQNKHRAVQKKLAEAAPTLPPYKGYLVNAQWDGRTIPNVQWALDVTRQVTVEYEPFQPAIEVQLQLLMPTRNGPANSPTFSAYDALSRNYFLTTHQDDYSSLLWGVTIAGDVNSTKFSFPQVTYNITNPGANMVGMEQVYLGSASTLLVFFDDGSVTQVDPASGASQPYTTVCNQTLQVNAVTARENTRDIFLLTITTLSVVPTYGIITFNYATRQATAVSMQAVPYFNTTEESGFEMVWSESLQQLIVFFTGPFDQIMYINPVTGAASFAVFNMHDYQGSEGALEFTVSAFLEDLDTDANAAIDTVAQQIYFQCSQVDPDSGFATTSLCAHPVKPDYPGLPEGSWDYVNINIAPMTYGYAASEYVQIEQ